MHPPPHPCCTPTPFWLLKIVDWDYDEEAEIVVQQRGGEGDVVEFSSVFVGCEDDGLIHDQEGALEFATSLVKVEEVSWMNCRLLCQILKASSLLRTPNNT